MGCGVSKQEIAEPSRIQTVVVSVGSPGTHLKAHEANLQNGNACHIATTQPEPAITIPTSCSAAQSPTSPCEPAGTSASAWVENGEAEVLACSAERATDEELSPPLPTSNGGLCNAFAKEQEEQEEDSPMMRHSNGLVGTLASLDEILSAPKAGSLKTTIKVTAEKIMSYGGVLHSLEEHVGGFDSPPKQNGDANPLDQQGAGNGRDMTPGLSEIRNCDGTGSPAFTRSPRVLIEVSRKKLPPILTPPNSFMIDKSTDPFAKTPFPILSQTKATTAKQQFPTSQDSPTSNSSTHSQTKVVPLEETNVQDIIVKDEPAYNASEKSVSPRDWTPLKDLHSDPDIESIILLETLEAEDTKSTHEEFENSIHDRYHNICGTSLTSELASLYGVKSPRSTCSARSEDGEGGESRPLSSSQFYS